MLTTYYMIKKWKNTRLQHFSLWEGLHLEVGVLQWHVAKDVSHDIQALGSLLIVPLHRVQARVVVLLVQVLCCAHKEEDTSV